MASVPHANYRLISDSDVSFQRALCEVPDGSPLQLDLFPEIIVHKANRCATMLLSNFQRLEPNAFEIQIRVVEKKSKCSFFGLLGQTTTLKYAITVMQKEKPVLIPTQHIDEVANAFFLQLALPENGTLTLFFK